MSVKRILRRIRLDKIAAVDSPCQQHATVAIIKRAPTLAPIAKATFKEALDAAELSAAVSQVFYEGFDGLYARNDAFRVALTDELKAGGDGTTAGADYVEAVQSLVAEAVAAAKSAGVDTSADKADVAKHIESAVEEWLAAKSSPKESLMKIETKAALTAAIAKFDPAKSTAAEAVTIRKAAVDLNATDELPADGPLAIEKADPAVAILKREVAVLKLAPEARSYFDGLDTAGQDAFLAKSADDQNADVAKANAVDPIVYTTKGGIEVRKSEGATVLALAKQNDEQAARIQALSGDSIEKRATTEFPHVAADVAKRMLKSASTLGFETEDGKAIVASLGDMNKAADPMFKRLGSTEGTAPAPGINKARQTFANHVDTIAKRDNIGRSAAMEKAEVEFPEDFAIAYPPAEPAEATAD